MIFFPVFSRVTKNKNNKSIKIRSSHCSFNGYEDTQLLPIIAVKFVQTTKYRLEKIFIRMKQREKMVTECVMAGIYRK